LPQLRQHGRQWRWRCPIHKGRDDNFSVSAETGLWTCHSQCARGSSIYDLEMALTDTDFPTAAREVRRIVARPDLRSRETETETKWGLPGWSHDYLRERIRQIEAERGWKHTNLYPYLDTDGALSYVKIRFVDEQNRKTFLQYAVSAKGGWVSRKKAGRAPILYRLNTLGAAEEIFIVNGEKAADRGVTDLGIVTTCAPDGEGRWRVSHTKALAGKSVLIVVDCDQKGELHGKIVAEAVRAVDGKGLACSLAKQTMREYLKEAFRADDNRHIGFAASSLNERRITNLLKMAQCLLFPE
jgi:hypothetical protein